jgi:hypothetical protein
VALVFAAQLAGCGTLLYPERRGQAAGKYDTDIILLDAAGLLVGIVPGVIAFAVDLTTGAIYLPVGQTSRTREIFGSVEIERVPFEGDSLEDVEEALREHSGVDVDLRAPSVRFTRPAEDADLEALLRQWNHLAIASRVAAKTPQLPTRFVP